MFFSKKVSFHPIEDVDFEWFFNTRKVVKVLIDLRSKAEFDKGHYQSAINIPLSPDFVDQLDDLFTRGNRPKSTFIFVYHKDQKAMNLAIEDLKKQYSVKRSKFKIKTIRYEPDGYSENKKNKI